MILLARKSWRRVKAFRISLLRSFSLFSRARNAYLPPIGVIFQGLNFILAVLSHHPFHCITRAKRIPKFRTRYTHVSLAIGFSANKTWDILQT